MRLPVGAQRRAKNPLLNVAAAFAIGAAVTYFIGGALMRRRGGLPPSDSQLREHVCSRLADLVSHPEAIQVTVESGVVRVSGRVLAGEMESLLMRLIDVPGVYRVHNALSVVDDLNALAS